MDVAILTISAIVGLLGLAGLITSLLNASPGQTKIIRLLAWPGIKPSDRVALPLSATLFLVGVAFFLIASPSAPIWLLALIVIAAFVSGVMLGFRRTEA